MSTITTDIVITQKMKDFTVLSWTYLVLSPYLHLICPIRLYISFVPVKFVTKEVQNLCQSTGPMSVTFQFLNIGYFEIWYSKQEKNKQKKKQNKQIQDNFKQGWLWEHGVQWWSFIVFIPVTKKKKFVQTTF